MRQFEGIRSFGNQGDRNPITRGAQVTTAAIAPHAQTQRYVYTAPAGKKLIINALQQSCTRATAAAPVGLVELFTRVTTIAVANLRPLQINMLLNAVGDHMEMNQAPQAVILPTESLDSISSDASTGGTVFYTFGFVGTEYDA